MKICKKNHEYKVICKQCPVCKKQRSAEWAKNNPEKVKQWSVKYYQKNSEAIKKNSTIYRQDNLERVKQYNAVRYQNNSEEIKKSNTKYRQDNPEKIKLSRAKRYSNNSEASKQRSAEWAKNNPEKVKASGAKFRKNNPEKVKASSVKFRLENPDKEKQRRTKYYQENREKEIQRTTKYKKQRLLDDQLYKLTHNLRTLVNKPLKKQGYSKKSKTFQLLGSDFETVRLHLIQSAKDNYGVHYSPFENYEIDHIIPCAFAKTEEELIKLQHYTNLQWLTMEDNRSKCDRLDWTMKDSITLKRLKDITI